MRKWPACRGWRKGLQKTRTTKNSKAAGSDVEQGLQEEFPLKIKKIAGSDVAQGLEEKFPLASGRLPYWLPRERILGKRTHSIYIV